ncbi:MAG: glycosyltransferase family 39 protein [Gemmataceae bacterium]|nr:glycosyltransferase family 39 protein [Gemmataceae bacterium]MDW8264719.1 glycosyltransferase family 39 protein [Gemmataceae bacterium]
MNDPLLPTPMTGAGPRSLRECGRWLWSGLFFPGTAPPSGRLSWCSVAVLAALTAALLYPSLDFHLLEPDEGRYAEIPREMWARGEWIVPYLQGEPYLDKPPLLYWLVMLSYASFGISAAAARLVPALAVQATVLASYLLGRRAIGERAAFWGSLLLAVMPGCVSIGRLLVLDGLLTLCTTVSLLAALLAVRTGRLQWGWWVVAAVSSGLGILTKGPVVLALVVPPVWLYRRLQCPGRGLGARAWLALGLVAVAVSLPWYGAMVARLPTFVRHFFWEHHVVRYLEPFDHQQPVWYYGPILLAGLLPGTMWLAALGRFLTSGDECQRQDRPPELGFLLLAGGWCVLFFSLSGCKLPTYILPAFPPLALALGVVLGRRAADGRRGPAVAIAGMFALLLVAHHLVLPWYARLRSPWGRPERVVPYVLDRSRPVVCFPRHVDSLAFYLERDDLRNYRSKHVHLLVAELHQHPETVVLCTHRHSLEGLRHFLPSTLAIAQAEALPLQVPEWIERWLPALPRWLGETPFGLCHVAIIRRQAGEGGGCTGADRAGLQ